MCVVRGGRGDRGIQRGRERKREDYRSHNSHLILDSNVAHRTGWAPYHEAPVRTLTETIAAGTIVQTRLTHMLLPRLIERIRVGGGCDNEVRSGVV